MSTHTTGGRTMKITTQQRRASMRNEGRLITIACGVAVALVTGCAQQEQQTMRSLQQPINCATAQGDIRILQSEKTHVAQQVAAGVTAISPAGFVLGALTGTESTKLQVASGELQHDDRQPNRRDQGSVRHLVKRGLARGSTTRSAAGYWPTGHCTWTKVQCAICLLLV